MTAPTLIIVRHGQIQANVDGRWHGATDSPLTATGRRQAQRTGEQLARQFPGLTAIYSSPLQRCRHTAAQIALHRSQAVIIDDDLREYGIGELEDTPFRVLHEEFDFFTRIDSDRDYAAPGGDSLNGVAARMVAALNRIATAHGGDDHVAIVTHGAATAIALAALLHADLGRWREYNASNCGITEVLLQPEPALAAFNRTDHL